MNASSCDFISGWISGVAGLLLGHPLDTIKVRQQTFKEHSIIPLIKMTFKNEGIRGFYKGVEFPALAAGIYNSLFFGAYGSVLRQLNNEKPSDPHGRKFCCEPSTTISRSQFHVNVTIAGFVGGAVTVIMGTPIDLIKTQLQVMTESTSSKMPQQIGQVTGPISCARQIIKLRGLRGLYIGGTMQFIRDAPSFALYILSYEHVICMLQDQVKPDENPRTINQLISGGIAGILSWVLFMPFDVVKSRIQGDDLIKPKYRGVIDCTVRSYHKDGLGIFFQGALVCTVRAFPVNAALFYVYEFLMNRCEALYK